MQPEILQQPLELVDLLVQGEMEVVVQSEQLVERVVVPMSLHQFYCVLVVLLMLEVWLA